MNTKIPQYIKFNTEGVPQKGVQSFDMHMEMIKKKAGDGTRTRDTQLGRLELYQTELLPHLGGGGGRIRTCEG